MLVRIAWRNLWRNKVRSGIVISAIIIGLWAGLFMMSLVIGLNEQRMNGAFETYLSHLQIHHPNYLSNPQVNYTLKDEEKLTRILDSTTGIQAFSKRIKTSGIITNAKGTGGIMIWGVFPQQEKRVSSISEKITTGKYLENSSSNEILIGSKLAEQLEFKLNSRAILTFQDADENLVAARFKVKGIFDTANSNFDKENVFVNHKALNDLMGLKNPLHEIAIICTQINEVDQIKEALTSNLPNGEVHTWFDLLPELGYAQEMMSQLAYVFMAILLFAMAFGIINSTLMAILVRRKEIGMLMAIGMKKKDVFLMIFFESVLISLIATPWGLLFSHFTIDYYSEAGINLASVAQGLENLGSGSIVYPYLPSNIYAYITIMTIIVSVLAAIYPALKAIKPSPVQAMKS